MNEECHLVGAVDVCASAEASLPRDGALTAFHHLPQGLVYGLQSHRKGLLHKRLSEHTHNPAVCTPCPFLHTLFCDRKCMSVFLLFTSTFHHLGFFQVSTGS